nr:immunoglobulin heavy chain junction region [Mus musculus]
CARDEDSNYPWFAYW